MFDFGSNDNEEVTHTSGCQRLLNSLICAFVVAPLIFFGSMGMLGWNERRDVCDQKAIAQGKDEAKIADCSSTSGTNGDLILASCDVLQDGLTPFSLPGTDFSAMNYIGTGLSVQASMYQCVESQSSSTTKDSVGGGTTTKTTYTYSKQWKTSRVDSGSFQKKGSSSFISNCGVENPAWPAGVPATSTQYQSSVKFGAFTLPSEYVPMIELPSKVTLASTPSGWTESGGVYTTQNYRVNANGIGDVKVTFMGNNWADMTYTALGENSNGQIDRWTASDSWLCSGFSLAELRYGSLSKDALFENMASESKALTWILRLVGFCLAWFAFSRLMGPCEVVADCIPCIGPCLGDAIEVIACIVACPPACACSMLVIGIVWVAMRPLVGIPLMLLSCCIFGGYAGFKVYRKQQQDAGGGERGVDPDCVGNAA